MPKQTKRKTVKPKPPLPSLPLEEKKLLLPPPTRHIWLFAVIALIAVALVASYAVHPWFKISTGTTRAIITIVMVVFLLGLLSLFVSLVKLFMDIWRSNMAALERDKHTIVIVLVLLLSIVIFSSTVYLFIL